MEWQTTSVFLPWELYKQYERQKERTLKDELPRSVGAQYATGDQWRNNSRKNEVMGPKQKQYPAVDGTSDRSKIPCCREQYCIGTWIVRFTNQSKLEVVKQEMTRVNIDILGISELRWTGMGEFNSDDHYIYCFGSIPSFFLELFLHWSPVAYWAPTDLGSSSFSILSFCLFILFMGFSRQEYWSGLPFPSPVDHIL